MISPTCRAGFTLLCDNYPVGVGRVYRVLAVSGLTIPTRYVEL